MIFNHECKPFKAIEKLLADKKIQNESVYLSTQIIPKIKTDRSWVTINLSPLCEDKAIVFVNSSNIAYLKNYKDLILIYKDDTRTKELEQYGKVIILDIFNSNIAKEDIINIIQKELDKIDSKSKKVNKDKEVKEEEIKEVKTFLEDTKDFEKEAKVLYDKIEKLSEEN